MFKSGTTVASSLLIGIAAAFLVAPAIAAETRMPIDNSEYFKLKPMEAMHMIDTGNKGFVTKDEFMKFQENFFSTMDKDHDGKINTQEWLGREQRKTDG
jgi:hypothetical protein